MTSDTTIVRMKHIRLAKLCSPGTRAWWKDHGLDWSDFLTNGIPAQVLLDTRDPLAARAVEQARQDDGQ